MNTLTGIEAHRVDAILKHSLDQLQTLSYVPVQWDENVVDHIPNQPVINSLTKTWQAEEQLKTLGEAGPSDLGGGKDIQLIKQAHRANRGTCRNLMGDRDSLQILMDNCEVSEELQQFVRYLNELKTQMYDRMTTTVEDEAANRSLLHDLTERERLMEETRDALQNKLQEVRQEKDHVTFSLDQTTRKTQVELQDIKQSNQQELETVERDMSEAITKAAADHDVRLRQLQDQVGGMQRAATETIEKNRDEEQRMRKDKSRSEHALNAKIAQYDEDMSSRKTVYDSLSRKYEEELAEYSVLKEYFDKIDADIGLAKEEDEILGLVKRRRDFGDRVVFNAVQAIQKIVRGKLGRIAVAKLKPKGKKGKKGKK